MSDIVSPRRTTRRTLLSAAALSPLAAGSAFGQSAEERGLAIAREAERRGKGWKDSRAQAEMILRERGGGASRRRLETRAIELAGDDLDSKSLMVFRFPPDLDGTALLTHSYRRREDDQWLYLPDVRRVRRIAGGNKSGAFLGSEFSFEDMRDPQIEKYRYRYLRDEALAGQACFVLERVPTDPDSGYTRQIVWLDKAEYRTLQVQFFDRKSTLLKTMQVGDHRRHLGRIWRAHRINMVNHQTGKSTELIWHELSFPGNQREADFERGAMSWNR